MGNVGKPRKQLESLPNGWQDYIIDEMSQGASLEEIKAYLNISNDVHTRWVNEELPYQETIKRGIELSKAWWMKKGRTELENKDFSYTGWYMNMKNRFMWKDRQDVTTNDKDLPTPILNGISKKDVGDDVYSDDSNKEII